MVPLDNPSQDSLSNFYFGPPDKRLFGLYYFPHPQQERDYGVVICNPWGQEYIRAHRALFQLGLRLSRLGFPVLHFDFFGTGDFAGEDSDGSFDQWQADLRIAIQELKRRSRVEKVFLVGLRLGASIAALVASGRIDIAGLVLWEPAVIGNEYLNDLIAWHREKQFHFLHKVETRPELTELLGFGLHASLLDNLKEMNLLSTRRKPARRILIIESTAPAEVGQSPAAQLNQYYTGMGAKTDYRLIESFKMWTEDPDKGLVPQPILEAAVTWLAEETI